MLVSLRGWKRGPIMWTVKSWLFSFFSTCRWQRLTKTQHSGLSQIIKSSNWDHRIGRRQQSPIKTSKFCLYVVSPVATRLQNPQLRFPRKAHSGDHDGVETVCMCDCESDLLKNTIYMDGYWNEALDVDETQEKWNKHKLWLLKEWKNRERESLV